MLYHACAETSRAWSDLVGWVLVALKFGSHFGFDCWKGIRLLYCQVGYTGLEFTCVVISAFQTLIFVQVSMVYGKEIVGEPASGVIWVNRVVEAGN